MRDRRRAVSELVSELPPGPEGQPGHKPGAEVVLIMGLDIPEIKEGGISIAVPNGSELLLHQSCIQAERSQKLRKAVLKSVKRSKWVQHGHEYNVSDATAFDYFEAAMSTVVLAHAAIEQFSLEIIPIDFVFSDGTKTMDRVVLQNKGIEFRLSKVAAAATGRQNLMNEHSLWHEFQYLKSIRDGIIHPSPPHVYAQGDASETTYGLLLVEQDMQRFPKVVEQIFAHYGRA